MSFQVFELEPSKFQHICFQLSVLLKNYLKFSSINILSRASSPSHLHIYCCFLFKQARYREIANSIFSNKVTQTVSGQYQSKNIILKIFQVTVCEDLNINRWLMRMMRLGLSSPPHPSPSRLSLTPPVQSRRTSDCFLGATLGANLKLSPSRGRRFSDSSSLHKGLRFRKSSKLSCFSYCERKNIVQFLTLFSTKVSVTGKVKFIFNR